MAPNNEDDQIARALCSWLRSQDISPQDGVPVLLQIAGFCLGTAARQKGRKIEELASLIGKCQSFFLIAAVEAFATTPTTEE